MSQQELQQKHEQFLYPVVRIFSNKAAGSGTLIYSEPDPKNAGEYLTFVLTNHHVIEDLIEVKKLWNSLLKRNIETEITQQGKVETFQYVKMSINDSSNRYNADILAYSKEEDMAILKIESPRPFPYVAKIYPKDKIEDIKLFMKIVVSGCSLAHEPFCNFGEITYLNEKIENKRYWMTNASSIFGNSGGALFLADTGELIGIPSRITGIQLGFGMDVVTWMGFSAHTSRIYDFLEQQELQFLFDKTQSYYEALEKREKKHNEALMSLKAELTKEE